MYQEPGFDPLYIVERLQFAARTLVCALLIARGLHHHQHAVDVRIERTTFFFLCYNGSILAAEDISVAHQRVPGIVSSIPLSEYLSLELHCKTVPPEWYMRSNAKSGSGSLRVYVQGGHTGVRRAKHAAESPLARVATDSTVERCLLTTLFDPTTVLIVC